MPFECYPVVVLKCHVLYMCLQFIQHWLLLWKLSKLTDHYTWYMYGLNHAYTWYIPCIYKVLLICSFDGQFLFPIIPSFNIRLSSIIIALAYSIPSCIAHHDKCMILKFWYPLYIPGIYQVYTASRIIHGIYMVYAYYIPRRGSRCAIWIFYVGTSLSTGMYHFEVSRTLASCSACNGHVISCNYIHYMLDVRSL